MDTNLIADPILQQAVVKALFAVVLGGLVGIERSLTGTPAGLRTCMMISLAACLFTILSVVAEPAEWRIAPQIVTGVGFLGAGAVLHGRDQVHGLTTAASVWLVAAIGMTCGIGLYSVAAAVTFLALVLLAVFHPLSRWLERCCDEPPAKKAAPSRLAVQSPRVSKRAFSSRKIRRR
jgi:putative Mg2+ transporter-C (MgtC) family protein